MSQDKYQQISQVKSLKGDYVLTYNQIPLDSLYDPKEEVKREVNSLVEADTTCLIIFGIGSGHHIRYIRNKFYNCKIIILEPNEHIAKHPINNDIFNGDMVSIVKSIIDVKTNPYLRATRNEKTQYIAHKKTKELYEKLESEINKYFIQNDITQKINEIKNECLPLYEIATLLI